MTKDLKKEAREEWYELVQTRQKVSVEDLLNKYIDLAHKEGYLLALRVLERHIEEQVYQPTINTNSLLIYIKEARDQSLNNIDNV